MLFNHKKRHKNILAKEYNHKNRKALRSLHNRIRLHKEDKIKFKQSRRKERFHLRRRHALRKEGTLAVEAKSRAHHQSRLKLFRHRNKSVAFEALDNDNLKGNEQDNQRLLLQLATRNPALKSATNTYLIQNYIEKLRSQGNPLSVAQKKFLVSIISAQKMSSNSLFRRHNFNNSLLYPYSVRESPINPVNVIRTNLLRRYIRKRGNMMISLLKIPVDLALARNASGNLTGLKGKIQNGSNDELIIDLVKLIVDIVHVPIKWYLARNGRVRNLVRRYRGESGNDKDERAATTTTSTTFKRQKRIRNAIKSLFDLA